MKKFILLCLLPLCFIFASPLNAYADVSDTQSGLFEADSIRYMVVKPAENGQRGEAAVIGFADRYFPEELIIPSEVWNNGNSYDVSQMSLSYGNKYSLTEMPGKRIVIPQSIKRVTDKSWTFIGTAVESVTINCSYDAMRYMTGFMVTADSMGVIIYVPKAELNLFAHKFAATDVWFTIGYDDYSRDYYGVTVAAIGDTDVIPMRFEENGLFYEVTDMERRTVKLIGATMDAVINSEEINETGALLIPEKVHYKDTEFTVTALGSHCLMLAECIVRMPDTIIEIEPEVFGEDVYGIYMSDSITELPSKLFHNGENWPLLTYIKLPEKLKSIPYKAFYTCEYLRGIVIPESVERIGAKAFRKNVKDVYILGDIPKNTAKLMGYMKSTTFHVAEKHVEEMKNVMASKIKAGKAKVKSCSFRETEYLRLNRQSINKQEINEGIKLTASVEKSTDYSIAWQSNTFEVKVSQKGKITNRHGSPSIYKISKVYAFDILSGEYAFCRLVEK